MPSLFTPFTLRGVTLRNRIAVSPMCEYSSEDGFANDWHLVHLGSRAVGGAGLVIAEATAVTEHGRISPADLGIWKDEQVEGLARCVSFIASQRAVAGIQLAHAGRKASTQIPWRGEGVVPRSEGGWDTVAPSPLPFRQGEPRPHELSESQVGDVVDAFAQGARRAIEAGFKVIEIHAAHGYLLHQFVSPLSNQRTDRYGGSFENRTRIVREVVDAVRSAIPESVALFVRISATDWVQDGWDVDQSVELVRSIKPLGVDLIDVSSGGNVPHVRIPVGPGYQVDFASRIRRDCGIATGAVGMITNPDQANEIITKEQADLVFLARQLLRDPYWPLHAAKALGVGIEWPHQYSRARD